MINFKLMKIFIFLCFLVHKNSQINHFNSIFKSGKFWGVTPCDKVQQLISIVRRCIKSNKSLFTKQGGNIRLSEVLNQLFSLHLFYAPSGIQLQVSGSALTVHLCSCICCNKKKKEKKVLIKLVNSSRTKIKVKVGYLREY